MTFNKGSLILLDYTAKIKDSGEVFETTNEEEAKKHSFHDHNVKYQPKLVSIGEGWLVKGFDEALQNTSVGDKKTIESNYNAMLKTMVMHGKGSKDSEEDKAKKEAVENRLKSIDVSEHVSALMNGEGDLSEDFKRKAATVFEAAVKSKVRSEVERMEDEYKSELEENINTTKEELTEKVDSYMNYVVEEWMKENELAIERGLKGEIAEDFISGLKQLFEDHYVDVPDEKYDVLEAQ